MFFKYMSALNASPVQFVRSRYSMVLVLLYMFCFILPMIFGMGTGSVFALVAYVLLFVSTWIGYLRRLSPSIVKLVPVSSKKRIVYDFMTALYCTVFVAVVFVAVITLVTVIICLATGTPITAEEIGSEVSEWQAARGNGCYDIVFGLAFILCMYFGGMTGGFVKREKFYIIYNICFIVGISVAMFFTTLPYNIKYGLFVDGESSSFFSNAVFEAMAQPWVCISAWIIAAVALIGAAIWLSFRYYDVKKY